ncbi:MAG: hypothetical protein GYA17_11775 [Chloroflexi bacterium]|nr:hypothetical protein [Chloroflexota bacterium]
MEDISGLPASPQVLLDALRYEVYRALRMPPQDWKRGVMDYFLRFVLLRGVRLALEFDRQAAARGFAHASQALLPNFVGRVQADGAGAVPQAGPLLVASNHPGSVDALVVAAQLERQDVKLIARDMPFLRNLPGIHACLIYSTRDMAQRAVVLRQALHHLENGGTLLLFPSGNLDPDPATLPGAEKALETWTSSAALFLRRIPGLRLVVATTSHMIAPRWLNHPLAAWRRHPWDRQFWAELMQTSSQLLFPGRYCVSPRVSFSRGFTLDELGADRTGESIRQAVIAQAKRQLKLHFQFFQD